MKSTAILAMAQLREERQLRVQRKVITEERLSGHHIAVAS